MSSSYILKAADIYKAYAGRMIFKIGLLQVGLGEKIGVVGSNGAGKSTLLAAIMGDVPLDGGHIDVRGGMTIIRQAQDEDALRTAQNRVSERRGHRNFTAPSLTERPSGGELTRAAIAEALSAEPDILLADEPTTNLDMDGVSELKDMLVSFGGALLLVSHDRELLDAVCGKIWEIEDGELRVFPGNYSAWLLQKERERGFELSEYEKSRKEERRLREAARKAKERSPRVLRSPSRMSGSEARINPGKGLAAQSAVNAGARAIAKRADMVERKSRPPDLPEIKMALGASRPVVSGAAIRASGLSAMFGENLILGGASFEVTSGKRTVLLGPNGSGKTTLLRMIRRGDPSVKIAPSARVGFFAQGYEDLDLSRTVLENARRRSVMQEHEARIILACLGIKGDAVNKKCESLSGGERAKAAFASLFASELNTLLLDEPTNHIDLYTASALEELLMAWKGTLLLVTHDLRLARKAGDRLLIIENKRVKTFEGTLDEYQA
ncbi:ABC transporter [Synergistales bacterium]|nr:ABC transporter [Synergistales bacterium]